MRWPNGLGEDASFTTNVSGYASQADEYRAKAGKCNELAKDRTCEAQFQTCGCSSSMAPNLSAEELAKRLACEKDCDNQRAACQEQAYRDVDTCVNTVICQYVSAAYTGGQLSPYCNKIAPFISRYVTFWQNQLLVQGLWSLIPDTMKASGIMDPWYKAYVLWNGRIKETWAAYLESVTGMWNEARRAAGLPPSAVCIDPVILDQATSKAFGLTINPALLSKTVVRRGTSGLGLDLMPGVLSKLAGIASSASPCMRAGFLGAEGAIRRVCEKDPQDGGWGRRASSMQVHAGKERWVWSIGTKEQNVVTSTPIDPNAPVAQAPSNGPINMYFANWGGFKDNDEPANRSLHIAIVDVFKKRFASVDRALIPIGAAIIRQVELEAQASKKPAPVGPILLAPALSVPRIGVQHRAVSPARQPQGQTIPLWTKLLVSATVAGVVLAAGWKWSQD